MKILLILPHDRTYRYRGFFKRSLSYAPLTLSTLAGLVPPELNADITIIDEGVQKAEYNGSRYDVVGITCVTSSAPRAYELSEKFRQQGSLVVLGGAHPTLNPEEASHHADIVVAGHAESAWPDILNNYNKGEIFKRVYRTQAPLCLPTTVPARCLLKRGHYLKIPTVIASRGCSHRCSFCSIHSLWNGSVCYRPLDEVIEEIKKLGNKQILFLDPNITADKEYAQALFKALIPLKVSWAGLATADISDDDLLLEGAVSSGCIGLLMGFESLCQEAITNCGKASYSVDKYKETVTRLHTHGIRVLGCFVLGFDEDTRESVDQTVDFVDEIGIDIPRYAVLTPFPGTGLFTRFKGEGRILTNEWSNYDTEHVVFRPKQMEPQELQAKLHQIWKRSYSSRRIVKRIMQIKKSRSLTSAVNFGFRHYATHIARRNSLPVE